jgi:hypothetical protein
MAAVQLLLSDLLLAHTPLDQEMLLAMAPVSREFRSVAQAGWRARQVQYRLGLQRHCEAGIELSRRTSQVSTCDGCKSRSTMIYPFDPDLYACPVCTSSTGPRYLRIISFTACRERLLLLPIDLFPCMVLETVHTTYGNAIRMYRWQEVIAIAFDKHGGPRGLQDALDAREALRKKRGLPREVRDSFARAVIAGCDPEGACDLGDVIRYCCDEFVRNGKGGKKGVRARVERYVSFKAAMPPCSGHVMTVLHQYLHRYVSTGSQTVLEAAPKARLLCEALQGETTHVTLADMSHYIQGRCSLGATIVHCQQRTARFTGLVDALAARGLTLRPDSRMCSDFIEHEGKWILEDVVDVMDEMRFYFEHTRYASAVRHASSELAKSRALRQWVAEGGTLGSPGLPMSLVRQVDKLLWKRRRASEARG